MSEQCKQYAVPLVKLMPKWVEFTETKGILRVLSPNDEQRRASGVIFLCPRCKSNKQKQHYLIFLFPNAPAEARPKGRFIADVDRLCHTKTQLSLNLADLSIYEVSPAGSGRTLLRPQDVCGWQGHCVQGMVHWRPTFIERYFP
jgi:hypothetical protein